MNFPNKEGVGVVHPLIEKNSRKEVVLSKTVSPFSFLFEGSDMRVEGKKKKRSRCYERSK